MDLNQFRGLNTGKMEAVPTGGTYVTETDVDWSLKHFFVLLFLGAGLGVLAGYWLSLFNAAPGLSTLLLALTGLSFLLAGIVFQSLFLKSFQLFLWVALAETASLLIFFYARPSPWMVFGAIALVAHLISGFSKGRLDLTDHLRIHFGRFSRIVLNSGIAGLAVFFAFFYVGAYRHSGVSFDAFRFVTAGSQPVLARFVPEYNENTQVEAFFEGFARAQLATNPQFVMLLESDQDQVVQQTGFQLRNQVAEATKTPVEANETFIHYLYRITVHYLIVMDEQRLSVIPIMLMLLAIYAVIRGTMFLLKWPIIVLSYIVYRILLSTRVVYITTEPRNKEIIMTK